MSKLVVLPDANDSVNLHFSPPLEVRRGVGLPLAPPYHRVQFSSVTQSCLTLCNHMDCSTPGLPVHHQLPELHQTHVHPVGDATQPSHLSSIPFSSCLQSCPASGSFPVNHFFESGGQSTGTSASIVPMNTQDWSPLGWSAWISLQSKGLSRVFSNTTVEKHQFFGAQLSLCSNSHVNTWPLENHHSIGSPATSPHHGSIPSHLISVNLGVDERAYEQQETFLSFYCPYHLKNS